MNRGLIKKMERTIEIIDNSPVFTGIMIEFHIPDIKVLEGSLNTSNNPYILLTYPEEGYTANTRKISLGSTALQTTPEVLALHVIQSIAEFEEEVEDIVMG